MRRWTVGAVIMFAIALIVGAGYLGLRNVRKQANPDLAEFQSPPIVQVTRGNIQQTVIAPGVLVDMQTVVLGARIGGWLSEINVRPGDVVRAGDVVARLRADDLRREMTQAEAELHSAQLRLSEAEKARARQVAQTELDLAVAQAKVTLAEGANADALTEAERALAVVLEQQERLQATRADYAAQVTIARVELARVEDELARARIAYKEALDRPWEPQEARDALARVLQQAEWNLNVAQARRDQALAAQTAYQHDLNLQRFVVAEAEAELSRLKKGIDPLLALEVQRVQQRLDGLDEGMDPLLVDAVEQAQRDLERLRAQLAYAEIVAPMDGVVLEVLADVGETVAPGTGVVLLTDPSLVEIRTTVIEEDVPLVQSGQPVELYFDAWPDAAVQGRVSRIVPQRVHGEDRPLYHVYLAPNDTLPDGLLPGMTVDASIIIAQRIDALLLPRAIVQARSDGTAQVVVWTGGRTETRTIKVGLRGDVYVEILEGLRAGEQVVGE